MDFQAVVRRAGGLDGAQADEAADAVIDVDDDVAGGQARHLGDEILRALDLPARAHEPLAQNVFFGDQRDVGGREAGIEAEHRERGFGAGERQRLRPRGDRRQIEQPMLGQHVRHSFARAFAPQCDDDALAGRLQRLDVLSHRLEDVGAGLASFGGEVVPGAGADLDRIGVTFRRRERRQPRQRGFFQALAPFGFGQIEPIGRQRLIGRAGTGLIERVLARLIIIGDLRQPLVRGFFRQRLDDNGCRCAPPLPSGERVGVRGFQLRGPSPLTPALSPTGRGS